MLEERGEARRIETECSADLTVNANIPERYVPAPEQRMDLYRRIAAIRTDEDASDLLDEMLDRYGDCLLYTSCHVHVADGLLVVIHMIASIKYNEAAARRKRIGGAIPPFRRCSAVRENLSGEGPRRRTPPPCCSD